MPEKQKQPVEKKPAIEKVENNNDGFFNEAFNKKLPFLLVGLVFFLLTLYTFFSTGFTFSTIFDFGKFASDPTALYSTQLIIFAVVFAVTLSLTTFFGFNLKLQQAGTPLAAYLVIALLSFAVAPSYALLFVVFALTFGAGSILASMSKEFNYDALSNATRRALTIFLVLAVLFTIVKVELNKDAYMDQFLTGAAGLAPQLAKQVLPLCSQPFSKVNPEDVVPRTITDTQARAGYEQYRGVISQAGNCNAPQFAELNQSVQTTLLESQHTATVASIRQLLTSLTDQLSSPELQEQLSNFKTSKKELNALRQDLRQVSYFQLVETYFSIFVAFILFSLLSLFTWAAKLLGYPLNYGLAQLNKVKFEAKE